MLGLKRGKVELLPHQEEWATKAGDTAAELWQILGDAAVDIQHVGSTSIPAICAKPILDLVVGVRDLKDVLPYRGALEQCGVVFRGEDAPGQLLFVMGDFEKDLRTHHIHVVQWGGEAWENYVNFRDYLTCFPQKAWQYDRCKKELAAEFSDNRNGYTAGTQELIRLLLQEAHTWRAGQRDQGKNEPC